jgi:tetratricopeptide (TPR) repeat protein
VPEHLVGRGPELSKLRDAWEAATEGRPRKPNVLTFVALGGEGKTSLVARWAVDLQLAGWPGCESAFAWSFYSQGTHEQVAASSDLFLKEALTFFGDAEMAASARGGFEKGKRLAQLVGEKRALLILDGLEPLQYAPTAPTPGELKDQGVGALLRGLSVSNRGLCVVTTRYSLPDLKAYRKTGAPEQELKGLSKAAGADLLTKLGVKGARKELERLVKDVSGHALTLNLLGTYLRDAHAGDVRKRDLVKLEDADAEERDGHAFRVMDAYVEWFEGEGEKGKRAVAVLRLMGLFDRPATADCLTALLSGEAVPGVTESLVELSEAQRNVVLARLESAKLISVNRDGAGSLVSLDAHPLVREYFARQLRGDHPAAWRAGHRRLFEHLAATTKEGERPTLEDLQPLYQAVAHGCHVGLYQEALEKIYYGRIVRGNEFYSTRQLGASGADLGAVACFFDQPWGRVSPALPDNDQAWVLNFAAFCLQALGRPAEAGEPMRAGLKRYVRLQDWTNAATVAANLSELELVLGDVAGAVKDAEQAIAHADRSEDPFERMTCRARGADALHQVGRRDQAEALFRQAEAMQAEQQPDYPLLYSQRGFKYCDLLLAPAERAAWQRTLRPSSSPPPSSLADAARVSTRAVQTLGWLTDRLSHLTIALTHLTLARAALYRAVLEGAPIDPCRAAVEAAVDGLRRAGQVDDLPRGLLTRAWVLFLAGESGAAADLDEAWEVAERGPMPLLLADVHLYRARLFAREPRYPWKSPRADLASARKLILKHGYLRRQEELEDAESAILGDP